LPRFTLTEAGATEIEKSGAGETTRVTATLCVAGPLDPTTFRRYVPGGAELEDVKVSCELPAPPVTTPGAKLEVPTAAGSPVSESATSLVNPFSVVTVIAYVTAPPGCVLLEVGEALNAKSGD
jgi:hypothetical protein